MMTTKQHNTPDTHKRLPTMKKKKKQNKAVQTPKRAKG